MKENDDLKNPPLAQDSLDRLTRRLQEIENKKGLSDIDRIRKAPTIIIYSDKSPKSK